VARTIDVHVYAAAPVEAVWRWLADARSWSTWTRFSYAELEREGVPAPDGVGAIRSFGTGKVVSREEILEFDPPHHLAYTLLSGMPVRDYRADVTLTPDGDGTLITWHSTFEPKYPATGAALAAFMKFVLRDIATRLAQHATTLWRQVPPAEVGK
jgi:uncharacterized protein YndB with AHSA1/START domain